MQHQARSCAHGSNGSMTQVSEALILRKFIMRHNYPDDDFHLDKLQTVCCRYKLEDGVTYITISTVQLLINLARAENTKWEIQGHFDGSFCYSVKDFCLVGFSVNRLGAAAHYKPVSISSSKTESKEGLKYAFCASTRGTYQVLRDIKHRKCDSACAGYRGLHILCTRAANPTTHL